MASWDFTVDSEKQNSLADKLSAAADNFDEKVTALYGQIDSMEGSSWIGEDYDTFHTGVHNYEGALKDLSDGFRMFGEHFRLMASGTDTLATELISVIQNMTGAIAGGTSTSDGTYSPSNYGNDDPLLYRDSTLGDNYESDGNSSSPSTSYGADEEPSHGGGSHRHEDSDPTVRDEPNSTHQSESGATHGGGGRRFDDSDESVDASSNANDDVDGKSNAKTESDVREDSSATDVANTTYFSGDSVEINGVNYNVYGAIEKPNGEVVMLYGDKSGKLLYQNESGELDNVTYTYTTYSNGGRQYATHTLEATVDDLGTTINNGYTNITKNLKVGDYSLTSKDQVATTITCPDNGLFPKRNENVQGVGTFIDNQVEITTDGGLKTSYLGQIDGTSVNGSKIITATSMDDFTSFLQTHSGEDITLRIPQGQYVQWDSPSGGTGYEFSTSNGAVYLRWDSSAAGGQGAYHIVDEYGNVTNTRDFTLDGFNDNRGINGGVWK